MFWYAVASFGNDRGELGEAAVMYGDITVKRRKVAILGCRGVISGCFGGSGRDSVSFGISG